MAGLVVDLTVVVRAEEDQVVVGVDRFGGKGRVAWAARRAPDDVALLAEHGCRVVRVGSAVSRRRQIAQVPPERPHRSLCVLGEIATVRTLSKPPAA